MAINIEPILSLQTVIEYRTVDIDGQRYRLVPADAMPLFDRMDFESKEQRLGMLLNVPARTKQDEKETSELLDELCRRVLDAPAEVHALLNDVHRMRIFEAFIQLPRATSRPTEAKAIKAGGTHPSRQGKRSRGSRGSTVAGRANGSPKSPRASSEPAA